MNRASLDLCRWHAVLNEQALQKAAVEAILASAARHGDHVHWQRRRHGDASRLESGQQEAEP